MGVKDSCPWCDRVFTSNRYPPSAGYQIIVEKKIDHMEEKHPEKIEEYRQIIKVWKQKVYESKNFLERYKDIFNQLLGNLEGQSSPSHEIIEDYNIEELKEMSEEELRKVVEEY